MGFYRGFSATVGREVPFAMIQMPLLESAKRAWRGYRGADLEPYHVALCGCASGGFAAAVTTPLDVVKTRLMLGADAKGVAYQGVADVFSRVVKEEGAAALLSGLSARVFWISLGGFLFFGAYDAATSNVPFVALLSGAQGDVSDALRALLAEVKQSNALLGAGAAAVWVLRQLVR